jgi:hypothetical protein
MTTLADGLQSELARNRDLLIDYASIGPAGLFAQTMIELNIKAAERAILESDLVAMIRAYRVLKENN